jgi:branched-chain amino acid aminotransferase
MSADQPPPAIVDGTLVDPAHATIPITDEGLLRGDGVFEVVRLYAGRPFALEDHLERLGTSARNLRLPVDLDAARSDLLALIAAGGPRDAMARYLVTRGGHRIGLIQPLPDVPATLALATVTYAPTRILDSIKSLSYAPNMLATRLAAERGADEALLTTPHGRLLETPTKSFFYVLGGRLHTPPLDDHILDSITRRRLVRVTDATERVTTRDDVAVMEEAFVASTTREVHPVHASDDVRRPAAPGPVAADAAQRMRAHVAAELPA